MIGERKGCIKPTREANEVSLAHPKSENLMLAFFFSLYKEGTRFLWSTFPTLLIAAIELIVIDYQLGIQIHTRRSGTLKTGTRTGAIEVLKEFFLSRGTAPLYYFLLRLFPLKLLLWTTYYSFLFQKGTEKISVVLPGLAWVLLLMVPGCLCMHLLVSLLGSLFISRVGSPGFK